MSDDNNNRKPSLIEHAMTSAVYAPKILEQMIVEGGRALLGIFTTPAEIVLHPRFGTQAIHPITYVLAAIVLQIVGMVSFFVEGTGLINGWMLYIGFLVLTAIHSVRLWPKIINMDLEADGESEGPSWWIFYRLPFGFDVVVRCIYEPLSLIIVPYLLYQIGIVTPLVSIYCSAVALCLAVRSMLRYFEIWTYVRDMRNSDHRAKMLRRLVGGQLTREQAKVLVMTGLPADTPRELVDAAHKAAVEPAFAKLKTPKAEKPAAPVIPPPLVDDPPAA